MSAITRDMLTEIDLHIRHGRIALARTRLKAVARGNLPRALLPRVAQLSERCGSPRFGIHLLRHLVRPSRRGPGDATDAERAEYAACLSRIGAPEEAEELLHAVDPEKCPRALLYLALSKAVRWQYRDSIPHLSRYLALPGLETYARLVGEVNLAAAMVFEREDREATSLLRRLVHETSVRKLPLLLANSLELSAEHFVLTRKFREAHQCVAKADALLAHSGTVYELLVRKWREVLAFAEKGRENLDGLRRLAADQAHWETVRDCDRFTALRDGNRELGLRLFFGTPFEEYRRKIQTELGLSPPEAYVWPLGGGAGRWSVDLVSGEVRSGAKVVATLKLGQVPHRLLGILASDFYRPFRLAELHSRLNPGDHFHLEATPKRMHRAMILLRKFIEGTGVPLTVDVKGGTYRLLAKGPLEICVSRGDSAEVSGARELDLLREAFGAGAFSTRDAVSKLEVPRRSVQRALKAWLEAGLVQRRGAGGHAHYRFSSAE